VLGRGGSARAIPDTPAEPTNVAVMVITAVVRRSNREPVDAFIVSVPSNSTATGLSASDLEL
jgi:hypothetical protein